MMTRKDEGANESGNEGTAPFGTAIDPVCGMAVKIEGAEHVAEYHGAQHYFCSSRCHDKFLTDPELYLSGAHLDAVEEVPEGTIYTCPMHPEIRQPGPGACPICGMAPEPSMARPHGPPLDEQAKADQHAREGEIPASLKVSLLPGRGQSDTQHLCP